MSTHNDLCAIPFFSALDTQTLADVSRQTQRFSFRPGEQIMYEGEQPPGLFVILHGRVRLSCTASDGREQVLDMVGPGEIFNMVPIFDGRPNHTNARAMSPVDCLVISRQDMLTLLRTHPDLALAALADMAGQLRELVGLVEDLAFRSVRARLARQLLAEARTSAGSAELTHQELAERAGTVREMAGRALRRLAQEGLVHLERGRVSVLDAEGLARVIEE
jgi:CRP/FNR family transcriptional regulator